MEEAREEGEGGRGRERREGEWERRGRRGRTRREGNRQQHRRLVDRPTRSQVGHAHTSTASAKMKKATNNRNKEFIKPAMTSALT